LILTVRLFAPAGASRVNNKCKACYELSGLLNDSKVSRTVRYDCLPEGSQLCVQPLCANFGL